MRHALAIALLAAAGIAVYFPAAGYGFINFDDPLYVTDNPVVLGGLSWDGLAAAFTDQRISLWTPLTLISYQIEVELFGIDPAVMHRTNIALHLLNTVLLYVLLFRMTGQFWPSLLVGALFAVHPTHVESVAWVAERKDVLSTAFWMLTSVAWVEYVRRRSRPWYAAALLLFVLGLLAKPMLMTLPAALLLLDYWPLNRLRTREDLGPVVREKIPLFVCAAVFAGITLFTQSSVVSEVPLADRVANAFVAYLGYIEKTLYPVHLAAFYPLPRAGYPMAAVAASAVVLAALTAVAVALVRRAPYIFVGWFWFVGTLLPVIGGVQVGGQAMADRYTYIPTIGLFILIAWAAQAAVDRWKSPRTATALAAAGLVAVAALGVRAHQQTTLWKDSGTLFEDALRVTGPSVIPYTQLTSYYISEGRLDEAMETGLAALALYPDFPIPNNLVGWLYLRQGDVDRAIPHLHKAAGEARLRAGALQRLGAAYLAKGDLAAAETAYRESIAAAGPAEPVSPESLAGLIQALLAQNRLDQAEDVAAQALAARPGSAYLHFLAGNVAKRRQAHQTAEDRYRNALELDPNLAYAWLNLGNLKGEQGDFNEAVACFKRAVAIDPSYRLAHANLARAYRALGETDLADHHESVAAELEDSRPE